MLAFRLASDSWLAIRCQKGNLHTRELLGPILMMGQEKGNGVCNAFELDHEGEHHECFWFQDTRQSYLPQFEVRVALSQREQSYLEQ